MKTIARWSFRHRFIVLAGWLVLLVGTLLIGRIGGTDFSNSFSAPGTGSAKAADLLSKSGLHAQFGDDTIVIHTTKGAVTDPAVQAKVETVLAKVSKIAVVRAVRSPYDQPATQISTDGRTAFVNLDLRVADQSLTVSDVQPILDAITPLRSPELDAELGGQGFQTLKGSPFSGSVAIGLIAAAIVLFIAFGSLLSMVIPLISAVLGLGVAIEVSGIVSNVIDINSIAPTVAALIGLGVGIDYALFVVTRHRNGLKAGLSPEEAAVVAVNTSGRAVIFAGGTVVIAILGLAILQVPFLTGVGVAAAITVFFAVATATTLLPALFGMFKLRVLSRRERRRLSAGDVTLASSEPTGAWARWAAFLQRRPAILSAAALVVMAALVVPAFSIQLGATDQGNDPASSTTRKAYDLLAEGFGAGYNAPLQLVSRPSTAAEVQALATLTDSLRSVPGVASVAALPATAGSVSVIRVIPTTSPQSSDTTALVKHLRANVIPDAERGTQLRVQVGGEAAIFIDFADVLGGKLPLFILVIVLLGALLLMLAFRSIAIPLTAAVMNLLSAGAAFGVIVAVFQWGWGLEAIGLGKPGPIDSFLPVMMIAILFGLSMDYQVFLVSRMHEEWLRTGDNHRAVRVGQAATGRIITAAAAIMIFVFLAFVFTGKRQIGEFGLGLASSVFIDAVILRTVLVPALMHVLGRANWWLPRWLDRILPNLGIEPREDVVRPALEPVAV